MEPEKSRKILIDVQTKLLDIMEIINELPQGYKYKVREMLSCAETVVSMYDDIQHGIIPDILKDDVNINTEVKETKLESETVSNKKILDLSGIKINI
ncbi:hypothetical protein N0S44_000217 [Escherichia coli]|nr:hypothetical protein [Escherichia coli]EJR1979067.1 hypothetical protein [Escherichia coli]